MTTAIEGTPTNGAIGWMLRDTSERVCSACGDVEKDTRPCYGENYYDAHAVGGSVPDYCGPFEPAAPDYLNDPATLGEWNRLLAERGWTYAIDASAPDLGIVCTLFLGDAGEVGADEGTELRAKWIAAWRAEQASKGA